MQNHQIDWGGSEKRCEDKAFPPWVGEEKEPKMDAKKKTQKGGRRNKRKDVPESGEKGFKGR